MLKVQEFSIYIYMAWTRHLLHIFPCGGGIEYLHRSPVSRKRRRTGNPVPGGTTGPPCSWGIQLRGSGPPGCESLKNWDNKIWSWVPRDCAGDPSSRQRGCYKITNPQLSKENFKEKEKFFGVLDGCLTPRRTGRLTVGHNSTSTSATY
jgi:hypothetical protein